MEAVGLAASVIALLGVAKKLAQAVGSLLGATADSNIMINRIILDLTAVHECLQRFDAVDAGQDLVEACSGLESSLTACLSKCMDLSAEGESLVRRFKTLLRGRTKTDIVLDLRRIEVDVSALFLRFFMKALVRSEMTARTALSLTKQSRDDIYQRLDSIERHLKQQTASPLENGTVAAIQGSHDSNQSSNLLSEIHRLKHVLEGFSPAAVRQYKSHSDGWASHDNGTHQHQNKHGIDVSEGTPQ